MSLEQDIKVKTEVVVDQELLSCVVMHGAFKATR